MLGIAEKYQAIVEITCIYLGDKYARGAPSATDENQSTKT